MFKRRLSVLLARRSRSMRKPLATILALLTILTPVVVPLADAQTRLAPSGLKVPMTGTLDGVNAIGTFRIARFVPFTPESGVSTGIGAVGTLVLTTENGTTTIPNFTMPVGDIATRAAASPGITQV